MLEDGGVIQGWRHRGCLCWCEDSLRLWFGLRYQKHSFTDFTHLPSEKSIKPLNPDIQRVKLRKCFSPESFTTNLHCADSTTVLEYITACIYLSVTVCQHEALSPCSSHTELWSPVGDSQLTWNTGEQKYSGRRERNDDDSNVEAFAIKRIWGLKVQRRCAPTYFCLVVILIILKWNSSNFLQTLLMCT